MGFLDKLFKGRRLNLRPMRFAGMLYPEDAGELEAQIASCLAQNASQPPAPESSVAGAEPRALIVPQAEYEFAGETMGAGYRRVRDAGGPIARVVLVGSSRLVPFRGVAVTRFEGFETPLGPVVIDTEHVEELLGAQKVRAIEPAFEPEASLEVQLPFLRTVLDDFAVVPLLVGDVTDEELAGLLEPYLGETTTLVVVSANMSHDKPAPRADELDEELCGAIEALDPEPIGREHSNGRSAIRGLLRAAAERGLSAKRLARSTSAAAAEAAQAADGPVTGYGAFVFA